MRIDLLVQKTVVHKFFADSTEYVSITTAHSSNAMNPFFCSNNDEDFF